MNSITLLLGGPLRRFLPDPKLGTIELNIEEPTTVASLLERESIPVDQARIVLINHKKGYLDSPIQAGDRVAIFPPQLAFNMYVATGLAHQGRTHKQREG